ncbi:MAG: hypothetical protein JWN45_3193 [Acidobacteriaceae bacterium]|nr:hypothetical protein [Acidobacteriaceae bacterium]
MTGNVTTLSTTGSSGSISLVPKLDYSRWAQGAEIAIAFLAIQATLWSSGRVRLCFHLFAAFWIVSTTLLHRKKIARLGFNIDKSALKRSAWIIWMSIGVSLALAVAAYFAGTLHTGITLTGLGIHLTAYSLWALMQQFIAQSYFFIRFESLLGSGKRAVLPTAILFAAAHLPNPVLLVATAVGGVALTEVFRRYRTLYTIAIAHAVVGVAITLCVPDDVDRHMRVGIGYLHYRPGSHAKAGFLPRADRPPAIGTKSTKIHRP